MSEHETNMQEMIERRNRLLGKAYRLFYSEPVHIVRGEGVWLYDADGRQYLDVYNNVPHVGHCHPHVVDALTRQIRTLNTHTRYLHEGVLDYAGKLVAKFPEPLRMAMFACTGTEANELALRIARAYTGGTGIIATENAYHGNSFAIAQISTSYQSHEPREPNIVTVPAPDSYRGRYREDDPAAGERFAAHLDEAIATLESRGIKPAAFIVDTIFSSDGLPRVPAAYLQKAVERVRTAGGVFVADEVQPGFGRTGRYFWGFEGHGVVPDIVTLGKPMGNGHPISAVVTSPEIIESFEQKARYFNTFGGNPVSCAAASAVLEVIEMENLQQNAAGVGNYIKEGLNRLAEHHEAIGDIRGSGLFIGIDIVSNRENRTADGECATKIVDGLRQRGVLVGSTGPHNNVVKVRPSMVFGREHADLLLQRLDETLAEC